MKLGVCYYPEQWPPAIWPDDARRMREVGISYVRIAEFAWAQIEPEPGVLNWTWLDRAVETLHAAGLLIVMGTPTATPPKWLVDAHPEMLAVDAAGNTRRFGSRRHYCFSSPAYRDQAARIVRLVAERYGNHAAVAAWQTDNEYGCHDTVLSYSAAARRQFRRWLQETYADIDALNRAWGNTFWSQTYRCFDRIDPPVATVTEANPAHRLDWQRFGSDEVVAFNRAQVEILRECSPGRDILHNFMGFFTGFDHHKLAADLDIATWDSYPLGFTQMFFLTGEEKAKWSRTGHPDIATFHHDLYRGMCVAKNAHRWWVMEQQPGPVNWAHWNPAPHEGMVRLWTWQAFAHGAEVVSYFRWRQAPFAQEQMHAGLLRVDGSDDQGLQEVKQVDQELRDLRKFFAPEACRVQAHVALVFDYDAIWMNQIQPQGADYNGLELLFRNYSALRRLGLDVDIVSPRAALDTYRLIVLPLQFHVSTELVHALEKTSAQIVMGPRAGSKTAQFQIPLNLPPGPLALLTGLKVQRVASLPPGVTETIKYAGQQWHCTRWREDIELGTATAEALFADGRAAIALNGRTRYVATWLSDDALAMVLNLAASAAGLAPTPLAEGLRISRIGRLTMAFNIGEHPQTWIPEMGSTRILGEMTIPPRGMAIWTD